MKWVRIAAIMYAAVFIIGAIIIFAHGQGLAIGIYLVINGLVVALAIIFERGRYRPKVTDKGDWQTTNEKFQDPTTGKWMTVRYNRQTGERDYIEIDQ